jgi:hypothetical protein
MADAKSNRAVWLGEIGRGDTRARLEIGDIHAVALAIAMHIAGLERIKLGEAGSLEGRSNGG